MKKKASVLFILRLLKMGISILTLSLSAKYFGVTVQRDVWVLAFNCILVLDLAIWGPLNETFRARFIFIKEDEGEEEALRKTRSILVFTNIVTVVIVAILVSFPEAAARVVAPTLKGNQLAFLLLMIRVIAPSFLFNQLIQIFIGILNAYNSIYIPEISSFISGIINLFLIIFLAPVVGIYSLAYAYYFGLLLLLILLLVQIYKLNIGLFRDIGKVKLADTKPFLLFALPFFFPYFIGQVAVIIEKSIASSLGVGMVSIIDYSRKFSDILLSVLSSVLTTILVPVLSLKFAQRNEEGFFHEFRQIYQLGFLGLTAITAMFTACPQAFVAILYKQGTISSEALSKISELTMFYSWSAVAIFLYMIIGMTLIASQKGKIYAFYGISAQLVMIVLNLMLYKTLGAYIFPFSLLVSHSVSAFFMFRKLPYGRRPLIKITFTYLSLLILVVLIMSLVNIYLLSLTWPVMLLLANGVIFTVLMLLFIFALKLDERLILIRLYNKLVNSNQK